MSSTSGCWVAAQLSFLTRVKQSIAGVDVKTMRRLNHSFDDDTIIVANLLKKIDRSELTEGQTRAIEQQEEA